MLYEKRWTHSQDETILLNETENCELVFEPFLRFLYTASVQLNLTNVIGKFGKKIHMCGHLCSLHGLGLEITLQFTIKVAKGFKSFLYIFTRF